MTTPTSQSVTIGGTNTDGVVVTGNSTGGSPTGTVSFYVCGPDASPTRCTSKSNEVGSAKTLHAGADDTATATSASFTPTSTGYWCFAGYYSGDSNYSASSDTSTDECFDVTTASSGTTTTPTDSSINLGGGNTDGALVSGNATDGSPTGTVSFYVCGPTVGPTTCTSQLHQVGTAKGLTAGLNDTATATSASFTPTSTGYWCFAGYYSGDSNYAASSDTSTDECFDVTTASSGTTTTPTSSSITVGGWQHRWGSRDRQLNRRLAHGNRHLLRLRTDREPDGVYLTGRPGRGRRRPYGRGEQHRDGHLGLLHADLHRILVLRRLLLG